MTQTSAPQGRRTGRSTSWWLRTGLTVAVLGLVAVALVAQRGQLVSAVAALRHLHWGWVVAAVVAESLSMTAFSRLQRRLLHAGGARLSIPSALGIAYAGRAMSGSLPLAGPELGTLFAYRQYLLRGATKVTAAWVVVSSGVVSSVAFTVVVIAGSLVAPIPAATTLGAVGGLALLVPLALALVALRVPAVARFLERVAVRLLGLVQRIVHKPKGDPSRLVTKAQAEISALHLRKRGWAEVSALALVNWLADAGCLALAVKAAGLPLPARSILLVWSAAVALSTLNLTPGGLGVVEAALITGLVATDLPTAGATTAVLTYRLISFWLVIALGWVAYPFVRRYRGPVRRA